MRGEIKITSIYEFESYWYLPFFIRKKNLNKVKRASTEMPYQFSSPKVPVLMRNKATNSSTSNHPFFSCTKWKPLYLVIYSILLDLPLHRTKSVPLEDKYE